MNAFSRGVRYSTLICPIPQSPASKKPKQQTHLESFFARYPRFQYDSAAPVSAQYDELCRIYGFFRPKLESGTRIKSEWNLKSARDAAYAGFQTAMARTFAEIFGTDVNDLGNWQSLCRVLEIAPVAQTLWACRAVSDFEYDLRSVGLNHSSVSLRLFEKSTSIWLIWWIGAEWGRRFISSRRWRNSLYTRGRRASSSHEERRRVGYFGFSFGMLLEQEA